MARLDTSKMKTASFALALLGPALLATSALAVGTRSFQLSGLDDFRGGDLSGVSIDSTGRVAAGYMLGDVPIWDASSV